MIITELLLFNSLSIRYKDKDELALLTSSQAIEDIRYFIDYQKTHSLGMSNSPVILIGSHIAGSLAAWTQQKYPLLVNGVWAIGAPLKPSDYLPGFLKSIRSFVEQAASGECLKGLDDTFAIIKQEIGLPISEEYLKIFEMCNNFAFDDLYDQSTLLYRLFTTISKSVLLNNRRDFADLCYELMDPEYLDPVEAFIPYFLSRQKGSSKCMDYSFKHLLNEVANRNGKVDPWAYQSCMEYGWFPGGPENQWLQPNFFNSMCYNAFSTLGEEREEVQEETQRLMDGIVNGTSESKIILVYGLQDPWTKAGITNWDVQFGDTDRQLLFIEGELDWRGKVYFIYLNGDLL